MRAYLVWMVLAAGLLGCGSKALQPSDGSLDAGPMAVDATGLDAAGRDAAPACSSTSLAPFGCGTCGSDTGSVPTCVGGAWTCPPGQGDLRNCPVTVPRCITSLPSGCFCNPITGDVTCTHDAGADAPRG